MFVGTYIDSKLQRLWISERINGKRIIESYPLILEYYVPDESGSYQGYDGQSLKKIKLNSIGDIRKAKEFCATNHIKTYELGFNLTNKVLYQRYKGCDTPNLHKSFLDIEVDRKGLEYLTVKELVDKACCPINAISIYNDWQDRLFTLMLCPENIPYDEAEKICNKFDNTVLFRKEEDLLRGIMNILDDSDCACGWNSLFFDFPYITRRIINILGEKEAGKLCLFGTLPKYKEKKSDFGDVNITYEFPGKWFTDYLDLYKKHERSKKESYKLDSIGELELGERKVQHDESLDDMYRQRYEDFIRYNRQDTMIVKKLEDKLKYIDIHNAHAHDIPCTLDATMGTVGWVEQAIINEAHSRDLLINDKVEGENNEWDKLVPPGAYCADPVIKGVVSDIFSFDMSSLYPSCVRTLNISPDTMVGQFKLSLTIPRLWKKIEDENLWYKVKDKVPDWGAAWGGLWAVDEYWEIINKTDTELTLKLVNGKEMKATAKEFYNMIFTDNSNINITAFATLYRTDKRGLIPTIFDKWFARRKEYKKEMNKYEAMSTGVCVEDKELLKLLESSE